jgi:tetratricopeptide (TPR) repeat protein
METAVEGAIAERGSMMAGKHATPIVRHFPILLARGIDAIERNHIHEAVGLLRQAVQVDSESFYGNLALGIALTKALQIPAAEAALEKAVSIEPGNFWAHLRMAQLHLRVGVPKLARQSLETALNVATTAGEKKIARDLLDAEARREPKRTRRLDFSIVPWRRKRNRE